MTDDIYAHIYAKLATNLRHVRKLRNMTQQQLAERMGLKTTRMITHLESGKRQYGHVITLDRVVLAADVLEVELSELFK